MTDPTRLLIAGGRVFDGVNDEPERRDILVEGARIAAVAPEIDSTAERFDASGKWITPGFIDMHVHITHHGMEALPVLVGTGVTTVRDVGGNTARLKQMVVDIEHGKVIGPRIIYSGPLLHEHPARPEDEERGEAPGSKPIRSEADAREAVNRLIEEEGVGSLKIYETVRDPIAAVILATAEGRVPVTAHLGRASSTFVMEHGIGALEHLHSSLIRDLAPPHRRLDPEGWQGVPGFTLGVMRAWADVEVDGPEVERWLRVFLDHKCSLTPTVTVYAAWPAPDDPRLTLLPIALAARRGDRSTSVETDIRSSISPELTQRVRQNQRAVMDLIYRNGGDLLVGTDFIPGKLPGWALHAEMEAFQRRGISPADILRATTSHSAAQLRRDDIGIVAPEKHADLVILDADPTQDIRNVSTITHVVKGGVLHDCGELLAIAEPDARRFDLAGRI